jgi:hypothetical protein
MPQLLAADQLRLKSSSFRNSYLAITIQNNFGQMGLPALEKNNSFYWRNIWNAYSWTRDAG